jgi:hypothetical protein
MTTKAKTDSAPGGLLSHEGRLNRRFPRPATVVSRLLVMHPGAITTVLPRAGLLAAFTLLFGLAGPAPAQTGGFALSDKTGEYLDVLLEGKVAARYMYAYDKSSPQRLLDTYKPYLHVFDAEGQSPITKGPGGLYTHHRGIFIGWNKIGFNGQTYDRWHMKGGEIVHQKFLEQKADASQAGFTSLTHWQDEAGQPIVEETRKLVLRRGPSAARLSIDFTASLKAPRGPVKLAGDPEHSGVHYRPADEVVASETAYVFPKAGADPKIDLDYPWVGVTYTLNGKRYSVVEMNHPENPKDTKFSAYRDYGRFGAFFKNDIASGETLTIHYRFLVADGEMPPAEAIQKCWDDFAGVKNPSPVPPITVTKSKPKNTAKRAKKAKSE